MSQEAPDQKEGLEVKMPPQERVFGDLKGLKEYTYILEVTEPLLNALEEAGIELKSQIISEDGAVVLQRKEEFHLTCIGFGHAATLEAAAQSYPDGEAAFKQKVSELLSVTNFTFTLNPDSFKMIYNQEYDAGKVSAGESFESERTIIVDVETDGITEFYRTMHDELGIDFGSSVAHATLYIQEQADSETKGLGIAVTDLEAQQAGPSAAGPHITVTPVRASAISQT